MEACQKSSTRQRRTSDLIHDAPSRELPSADKPPVIDPARRPQANHDEFQRRAAAVNPLQFVVPTPLRYCVSVDPFSASTRPPRAARSGGWAPAASVTRYRASSGASAPAE